MGNSEGSVLSGSPNSYPNLRARWQVKSAPTARSPFLHPTPRPVPSPGALALGSSPQVEMQGEGRHLGLASQRPSSPGRGGRGPRKPRLVPRGGGWGGGRRVESLGRASHPGGPRPRPARGGARGRVGGLGAGSPTWVASHSSSAGTWCRRRRCSAETPGLCGSLPSPTRHGQAQPPEEARIAARTGRRRHSAPARG